MISPAHQSLWWCAGHGGLPSSRRLCTTRTNPARLRTETCGAVQAIVACHAAARRLSTSQTYRARLHNESIVVVCRPWQHTAQQLGALSADHHQHMCVALWRCAGYGKAFMQLPGALRNLVVTVHPCQRCRSVQAMAAYRAAARRFSGLHQPLVGIAMEYARMNNVNLALQCLQNAAALAPECASQLLQL